MGGKLMAVVAPSHLRTTTIDQIGILWKGDTTKGIPQVPLLHRSLPSLMFRGIPPRVKVWWVVSLPNTSSCSCDPCAQGGKGNAFFKVNGKYHKT